MTVYLVHSGKSDAVTMKMQAESPAHVPTKITGDPGMVNYLERDDSEEEPRCPSFDELLAELDAKKHERVEEQAAAPIGGDGGAEHHVAGAGAARGAGGVGRGSVPARPTGRVNGSGTDPTQTFRDLHLHTTSHHGWSKSP